jgi:hypothetical protein
MGQTPFACFSKTNSHDATNKHDTNGRTWPWTMCSRISKKLSKPLIKSLGIKQSHKSSYTILGGPLDERHGERVKAKINASLSKTRSIFGWKLSTKGGRSTSTEGWKWWRVAMVSVDGATWMLGAMHALIEHTPLHEQVPMRGTIAWMEVE